MLDIYSVSELCNSVIVRDTNIYIELTLHLCCTHITHSNDLNLLFLHTFSIDAAAVYFNLHTIMLTMAYFSGLSDCESLRHTHLSFQHYNNKFSLPFPVFADLSVLTIARGFFSLFLLILQTIIYCIHTKMKFFFSICMRIAH